MWQIICDFDVPTIDKEIGHLELFTDISYAWIAHSKGNDGARSGQSTFPHDILWCLMLKKLGDKDDEFKRVGLARLYAAIFISLFFKPELYTTIYSY